MYPSTPLGDQICELAAHMNAANCRLLELIAEFDIGEGWGVDGCNSCAHWLNWKCGIGFSAAREKVRAAHALMKLPLIRATFKTGSISYSKIRAITRVALPTVESQEYLLMIAKHGTAAHVETVVRGYRRAKADLELQEANERHDRRELNWYYDDDEMLVFKIRLAPEEGAHFIEVIETAEKQLQVEQGEEAHEEKPLISARHADALMHVLSERMSSEIQVHVSAEVLIDHDPEGCSQLQDGPNLAPHTVRRLSCDAGIVRIVEDAKGQPLDVGRKTRSIPPALKRALNSRDSNCRFPGCSMTRHLHGHHIQHWADGGKTSLDNLVQLCPHHHRLVHEGGFDVHCHGVSDFFFTRPDGSIVENSVPQIAIDACPEALLKQQSEQHGLSIDVDTAYPQWDGAPMDHGMAIDAMFTVNGDFEREWRDPSAEGS
jgi:hypothetical protein